MQHQWNNVSMGLYQARTDQSCVEWHRTNQPGTEWKCADLEHVTENHITTPHFVRADRQDEQNVAQAFPPVIHFDCSRRARAARRLTDDRLLSGPLVRRLNHKIMWLNPRSGIIQQP